MEPAVPFALLGVVQLLAVAGWVGLAGAACFPRLLRRTTALVVAGAAALAVADALTAVRFGSAAWDLPSTLRALGFLLFALGLLDGVLQPLAVPLPAVVVPLGSQPRPALLAAAAGLVAGAAAALRSLRRGADRLTGLLLAGGLGVSAIAAALAAPARTSSGAAVAELVVRAVGTVGLLAGLGRLASRSLLAKLVVAICAGVVAMASGAVGVVGPSLADQVQQQESRRLLDDASVQNDALREVARQSALFGQFVVECPKQVEACRRFLGQFSREPGWFAVFVRPGQAPVQFADERSTPLSAVALQSLVGSPLVQQAFAAGTLPTAAPSGPVVVTVPEPQVVVAAAVPAYPGGYTPSRKPPFVAVYGVRIDDGYLSRHAGGYDATLLSPDGRMLASSLGTAQRAELQRVARSVGPPSTLPDDGVVVGARGTSPTVAFYPVSTQVATLAVSQSSARALAAQSTLLQRLFLTALVVVLLVALLAFPLARRIADPVRRLTVAARRVRRGDLEGATSVRGQDEVALLGRAFNEMTASLRALTADLRTAADQEAALRARLETVLGSMSDGLVATDAEGTVTSVNPTAAELLGVDDGVGRPLADVADVRAEDGRALLAPATSRLEADGTVHRPDGTEVPVRVGVRPLGDGSGGLVVVLRDTRREREIERMKTEFLSNVSHELRTPLTPIRGYAEILRRPGLPADKAASYIGVIHESSIRMARVVDLLVDVAALDAGRVSPRARPMSVRELVDGRLEAWRERFPERAGDFRRKLAARLPEVEIDAEWVAKALDELADNAVKYTPPGTPVTLLAALGPTGDMVRVAVRDAGPGIAPAALPELLGDFSQADASATRKVGGMGLGLGFVRRVADALGLALDVRSEPGHGAEFTLDLPPAAPAAPAPRRGAVRRAARPTAARHRMPRRRGEQP